MNLILYNPLEPEIDKINLTYDGIHWLYQPFLKVNLNKSIPIYEQNSSFFIKSYTIEIPFFERELKEAFFYKIKNQIVGFLNFCPHIQVPLDLGDHRFFNLEGNIICKVHGAQFSPYDGAVLCGPAKSSLYRILVEELIKENQNFLIIKGFYK